MATNNAVYYTNGGGDEQYTPARGVEILLPYIEHIKGKTIWCPFDKEDSEFVKVLSAAGHTVVHTHIETGQDFFEYEPEHFDVIISNPPYKNKRSFWGRAMSFGKPFALLLPLNILSDSMINVLVGKPDGLSLLIPKKRMRFFNKLTGEVGKQPTFKAVYFSMGLLEKQLILLKDQ